MTRQRHVFLFLPLAEPKTDVTANIAPRFAAGLVWDAMSTPEIQIPHPTPEAEDVYRRWLTFLDDEFTRHQGPLPRAEIVRDQLYLGRPYSGKRLVSLTSDLPGDVIALSLDPDNVTLEPEHFAEIDAALWAPRKPLLWFWKMFDRSPVGLNHWLGLRFRCMLSHHIFQHVGKGARFLHGVDVTYGYNLSIGDGVFIRQNTFLDDRGEITIGDNAMIGAFARIYSHSHGAEDPKEVTLVHTAIGAGATVGSHAIVLAGQNVAPNELVGSVPRAGN